MKAKRILMTGGAGFIGSHLTRKLLSQNTAITVVDNLSTGRLGNLPRHKRLTFIKKDIQYCRISDFKTGPFDAMIHLAGSPSVQYSLERPTDAYENNLVATFSAAQLCRQLKIRRFIFASSAAVYGQVSKVPILESDPKKPLSPYGMQKLAAEYYLKMFSKETHLSTTVLRLFNVFGPGQDPLSPYSGVISIFQHNMQKSKPLIVYGDGGQIRDFIYIDDVVEAFIQAVKADFSPNQDFLVCNIAGGRGISLNQLIGMMKKIYPDRKSRIIHRPVRSGDIRRSIASIAQAKKKLNFKPRKSIFDGLKIFCDGLNQ